MSPREVAASQEVKARLYILDTNVLMHDPSALFRFQEHDILLPMVVLEFRRVLFRSSCISTLVSRI